MDFARMMKQARQMQTDLQSALDRVEVSASAGGGLVTVRMNGQKRILQLAIDPEVIDPTDAEMLQDLVLAAINDAVRQVDEQTQNTLGALAPGLGDLLGGLPKP